jgi:peptidoglycan/LPS O-acetylase OafA/YrhL
VFQSNVENYDPPLWTMFYEFLGSFMVFAIVAVVRSWRLRTWMLAMLLSRLRYANHFSRCSLPEFSLQTYSGKTTPRDRAIWREQHCAGLDCS